MCLANNIIDSSCGNSASGINQMWVIPCDALKESDPFTIDEDTRVLTEIKYNPDLSSPKWARIKFQQDTAFANNTSTRNGYTRNVAQQISFVLGSITSDTIKYIEDLADCCCIVAIVEYNNGLYAAYGISYNKTTQKFIIKGMKTLTEGSNWNSGADPAADKNEIIIAFSSNVTGFPLIVDSAVAAALPTY